MPLTSGTVSFEQRINDGDFQHRVAKAEITFSSENDIEASVTASMARTVAMTQVRKALGLEATPSTMQEAGLDESGVLKATTSSMEQRHAAVPLSSAPAASSTAAAGGKDAPLNIPESDQVGAGETYVPIKGKRGRKSADTPTTATESSSTPSGGAIAPTDEMLQAACQSVMALATAPEDALAAATFVRGTVAKYVGEPGHRASDIPQDRRQAFLAELLNGVSQ